MAKYLARLVSSALLVFVICINDLPKIPLKINLNGSYKITIFADDTSLIVNNPNHNIFENDINTMFKKIHEWFNTNLLLLNKKEHFIQFLTKNNFLNELVIADNNKLITNTSNFKFLQIMIDNTLSWKSHIDKNFA
jgi:uncharacterized protein YbcV (DUF1398 family)